MQSLRCTQVQRAVSAKPCVHAPRARTVAVRASVAEMSKQFAIEGSVAVTEGEGGLPKVVLTHECGSSAEVYLFGAVVTSWKQQSGDEILYVRPDAVFTGVKPISGGIPHCFPQFGPGEAMQQHGFARNLSWEISSTSADQQPDDADPEVEFVLTPSEYTRAMWDHDFKAVYTVTLHGEQLKTDLRILNEGEVPFEFSAALHSYFEVLGVDKAKVRGLKGLTFLDKSDDPENPVEAEETREEVTFGTKLVDSVYKSAPEYVELDVGTGAAVAITSTGWEDCVVWNPYTTMEACYKEFVCVENAKFSTPVTVPAGESWRATTTMEVIDL